jgi:GT2 family glycosyltransferase
MPTISIITASLNAGDTIKDCLTSIKNQTHRAEQVVVDGNSKDETVFIARKHGGSACKIISEQDKSLYEAINKGIAIATGDVIGTLNADDFYSHSKALAIVSKAFEDPDVDACYGDLLYVDRRDKSKVIRYWRSSPYKEELMYQGWMPPHPTLFVRRSVYENHGAYRLDMGTSADYEFILRALLVNRIRALYIPTVIAVMRTGGASNSTLKARWRANRMDRKAWTVNCLQPKRWTLIAKPLRKSTQYLFKRVYSKPWLDAQFLGKTDTEGREKEPERARTLSLRAENFADPVAGNDPVTAPFYVVTVNYRSENKIAGMIDSFRSTDILRKLIIVDHSRSESLKAIKADFPILVIQEPNIGYGGGLNAGLRQIPEQDALVLLCNPDIAILNSGEVLGALEYMTQHPNVGCLIPKLLSRDGQFQPAVRRFYTLKILCAVRNPWVQKRFPEVFKWYYYINQQPEGPMEVDWGSGSAMLVRNSLFPHPISFDERFFLYFEDVDLCAQMWRHGFSVVHYPRLMVYHEVANLSRKSIYYFAVHFASLLKFVHKYRGLFQRTPVGPDLNRTPSHWFCRR